MITAVMVDSREPEHIQALKFGVASKAITMLSSGDLMAVTEEGCTLLVERKTPEDLLNSLADDRLFAQMAGMAATRAAEGITGKPLSTWPYLVITGDLAQENGKVITSRGQSGWSYAAVQGALLSVQEMGVFVVHCAGDADYEATILRLGERKRSAEYKVKPARTAQVMGAQAAFVAGLPGIGLERVQAVMDAAGNSPVWALVGLVDLGIPAPVGEGVRKRIRTFLGLRDGETLEVMGHGNRD